MPIIGVACGNFHGSHFVCLFTNGIGAAFPYIDCVRFMVLAGIQSFFAGMILEVMAAKDRKDFEYRLNRVHGMKLARRNEEGK